MALAFVLLNIIPAMQAGTGAQEKPDHQAVSIEGHCSNKGCIADAVRECRLSETAVRDDSNATTIISVAVDGSTEASQPVCRVSISMKMTGALSSHGAAKSLSQNCRIMRGILTSLSAGWRPAGIVCLRFSEYTRISAEGFRSASMPAARPGASCRKKPA